MSRTLSRGDSNTDINKIRSYLDGNDQTMRKKAAKQVVSFMRLGENVQFLFSSMLRCVMTQDIELKKLAYLYLVYYAVQEPEQAIMAVNTFVQDSQDFNPLVRALAIRTMCRIRLENIAEHSLQPLKKCIRDADPYVRKTAALGVAKLYDFVPESIESADLFQDLINLINDENPMVVANAITAIFEINERRTTPLLILNSKTIVPVLNALSSSTECCQSLLLDILAKYKPKSHNDATFLIDRLVPFLKNSNPAVVIGAFRCIYLLMEAGNIKPNQFFSQIIPPLLTLVSSSEPEIQYVVLRTLTMFVRKFPLSLSKEIRMFFCKYNDPPYVKMEKLDIIVAICSQNTVGLVVEELNEYCNSVDVAFVQKSVRSIGQLALKIEPSARRCVEILIGLIKGGADYASDEAIVVMIDILRRYPGNFEGVIGVMCQNVQNIKDPRAKVAAIWVMGEYCKLIEKVDILIDPFLETFRDEDVMVQLQILASLVKIYTSFPEEAKDMVQYAFTKATEKGIMPDIKNKAITYWRLLTTQSTAPNDIVNFQKNTILNNNDSLDRGIVSELMRNIGLVSGVLHIAPQSFIRKVKYVASESHNDDTNLVDRAWRPLKLNNSDFVDIYVDYEKSVMNLRLVNKTETVLTGLKFAMNQNALGISIDGVPNLPDRLELGAIDVQIPIKVYKDQINKNNTQMQVAFKCSAGQIFGVDYLPMEVATKPDGKISQDDFRKVFSNEKMVLFQLQDTHVADKTSLSMRNVFVVGTHKNKTYVSFATEGGVVCAELIQETGGVNGILKSDNLDLLPLAKLSAYELFASK